MRVPSLWPYLLVTFCSSRCFCDIVADFIVDPPEVCETAPYSGTLNDVHCTMYTQKCMSWQVVAVIGLSNETNDAPKNHLSQITEFLRQELNTCTGQSELIVITPAGYAKKHCNSSKNDNTQLNELLANIHVADSKFQTNNSAVELEGMLSESFNFCPDMNLTSIGGMLMLFTDASCYDLCHKNLTDQQGYIIDMYTKMGYNIRLIHIGEDEDEECLHEIFKRCAEYTSWVCDERQYGNLSIAQGDMQICPSNDNSSIPTGWIIASSIITFVIIITCVGLRCFFRYKTLKKGENWSWFGWRNQIENRITDEIMENENRGSAIPNDYSDPAERHQDGWEILRENMTLCENDVLGSGAFSTVYLGYVKGTLPLVQKMGNGFQLGLRREEDDTYKVAVKRLPPHATSEGRADFFHEIEFMKELGYHPHVLALLGVVHSTFDPLIVIEHCSNGDLLSFIRLKKDSFVLNEEASHEGGVLRIKEIISIAWQISDGIVSPNQFNVYFIAMFQEYLWSKNFIHRDVAARNVLLTSSLVAKLGDFGLCRLLDSSLYTAKGGRLPIKWMAPESLKYYEYTHKSDVWSFGVLLFELFSFGEAPYQTVQPQDMPKHLEEGNRLPQPELCPNEIYNIMENCWKKRAEDRWDVAQIREELTRILNSDSASYGYLSVSNQEAISEECEI